MPEFDNHAIAGILDRMADLLEVSGADKFRFLSYRKAAHAIRSWPEDLVAMGDESRFTEIPGVGNKLAHSIHEILQTGTFAELEAVRAEWPDSLVELVRISGLGPVRARTLYETLGVDSVDGLETALADGGVAGLPGFGDKTVDNIRTGLEGYRRHTARLLLSEALPLAERVVADLRAQPGVRDVMYAGSLRRMRETVGDIDVLVSADDASTVMSAVRGLPIVTGVIASGETKTSVMTTADLQVDVRVVEPASWGAALQYFTGSKEHNVRLRELAKGRGLKVNEYGVFRVADDGSELERVAGASEAEVYAALGLDVPPPELREGLGEVEAALEGRLPRLVELGDVRGDLHAHTSSTDATSTLAENRDMAQSLGYEYVAVTDHAYELRMVRGLSVEQLERQWAEVDRLNADGRGPLILKGTELNIAEDGSIDYDDEVLARFDLCIASMHSGWGDDREIATRRVLKAMDNPFVDIIGHPTGRVLGRRDPIDLDMEAVLAKAGETGTAMEVNAYPDRLDLSDAHLRMARRYGVRFSIACDSHHAEQMRYMPYGVATARRGWVTPDEVLNCLSVEELRRSLRRARVLGST